MIALAYLFGSQARNDTSRLSDYDFAIYLYPYKKEELPELKLSVMTAISDILNSDQVDLVILNESDYPELKYSIIADGKFIYGSDKIRIEVEPKIMNEYFDFKKSLELAGIK